MKKISFILVFLFALQQMAIAGGPWPQPKKKGYIKISGWWVKFDQHYTDRGLLDPNVTTGIYNLSFYGEYGFTDRLTGIIYAPLFTRNTTNNIVSATTNEVITPGEALNSMGDIDIAIKYGLTKPGAKVPVSATLLLGIPTGRTGRGDLGNLQTGDGEFNQMIQIDAGTSFRLGKKVNGYSSAYIGFNNRTKEFSEEFRYGLEFGAGFMKNKFWLAAKLNAIESFKNGATAETTTSASIFANNSEFVSYSLEGAYYVTKQFGISAGFGSAFRGEIIAAAPAYTVGVFWDLSK